MIKTFDPLAVTRALPQNSRRGSRRVSGIGIGLQILVAIFVAGGILPASLLFGIGALYETRHLILPGVHSIQSDLSSETIEQASNELNLKWNFNHYLSLVHDNQTWQISPVELGLFVDGGATAQNAYQQERLSIWMELEQIVRRQPVDVLPVVRYRSDLARNALEKIASGINTAPADGTLQFENGKWSAIPGRPGQELDIEATLAQIESNPLGTFFQGEIPLVVKRINPAVRDLSSTASLLQASIQKPLKIYVFDPIKNETLDWSVPYETLAGWVIVNHPAAANPQVALDPSRLSAYLITQKSKLASPRSLAPYQIPADLTQLWQAGNTIQLTVRYLPTTYQVVAGDTLWKISAKVEVSYWMILKGNPGISDASLKIGQVIQIPSRSDLLPLPIIANKRIVISISKQHMWTYENGKLRKEYVISTGISDSPTMPGVYQIRSHVENAYAANWDLWMPNFMGIYEAVPGFMNGIHGLPMMSNGVRFWANALGRPATYGCILMGLKEAKELYDWADEGVIVEVDA